MADCHICTPEGTLALLGTPFVKTIGRDPSSASSPGPFGMGSLCNMIPGGLMVGRGWG